MPLLKVIKMGLFALPPDSLVLFMQCYRIHRRTPVLSLFFNTGELIFEIDDFVIDVLCAF
jgi:hypothetical protein